MSGESTIDPPVPPEHGEIPMDQKLEMLREALPRGMSAGSVGTNSESPPDPVEKFDGLPPQVPFTSETEVVSAPPASPGGFEEELQAERRGGGDTFIYKIWETNLTLSSPAKYLDIDNGTDPVATFWVLDGVWYESEPDNWPDPFTGVEHHVSYVVPTTGGPPP